MAGLAAATQTFERAAARVARGDGDATLAEDQTAALLAEHAFAANAAAIRTETTMVGTIINTVA